MDLNTVQLSAIILLVLGGLAALAASQPRPSFRQNQARTWQRQDEFVASCRTDPAWPAKEKFSKDMAKFRHDNAYSMALGRAEPAEELTQAA